MYCRGLIVLIYCDFLFFFYFLDSRMHHSSVVLSDGRVLLYGGRQSPFFLCSQLLILDVCFNILQDDLSRHTNESVQCIPDSLKSDKMTIVTSVSPCSLEPSHCVKDHSSGRNRQFCEQLDTNTGHFRVDVHSVNTDQYTERDTAQSLSKGDLIEKNSLDFLMEKEEWTEFSGGRLYCGVLRQSGDIPCPRWRHASTLVQIEGEITK